MFVTAKSLARQSRKHLSHKKKFAACKRKALRQGKPPGSECKRQLRLARKAKAKLVKDAQELYDKLLVKDKLTAEADGQIRSILRGSTYQAPSSPVKPAPASTGLPRNGSAQSAYVAPTQVGDQPVQEFQPASTEDVSYALDPSSIPTSTWLMAAGAITVVGVGVWAVTR